MSADYDPEIYSSTNGFLCLRNQYKLIFHQVGAYGFRDCCFVLLELIATQAQAGVQERLVALASGVQILH